VGLTLNGGSTPAARGLVENKTGRNVAGERRTMNKYDELIANLSRDVAPVSPAPPVNTLGVAWFAMSAVYVVVATHMFGPARVGAFSQLATEPRFLLESLLGAAAILWTSLLAFRAAIPAALTRQFAAGGLVLMALWLAQYVIGLVSPALEPSMMGKRSHCYYETMIYALPPILVGVFLIRRLYPLRFVRTAMSLSLAAGMLPALYMQLACMYEPIHILSLHILPGLLMVLAGAAIASLWRQRRTSSNGC
jgi:hypothetical protein